MCSVTCAEGTQDRTRVCVPPKNGGADCHGELVGQQACDMGICPGRQRKMNTKIRGCDMEGQKGHAFPEYGRINCRRVDGVHHEPI